MPRVNNKKRDLLKIKSVKCKVEYSDILKKYGRKTVSILASPSVSPRSGRPNRTTPYWAGWTTEDGHYRTGERVTVWNKTNWQLTHLLENGHFITNSTRGIMWSPPQPHIKPTFDKVEPQYVKAMRKAKIETTIK